MHHIILACALACVLGVPAKADETLKFRTVLHRTGGQTQQVGDVEGHLIGLDRQAGLVFFSDGSTGTGVIVGGFDRATTSGPSATYGYYLVTFADNSELWSKYSGQVTYGSTGKLMIKGTLIVTGGKGRYAGAKGDGTYEAEQNQSSALPGDVMGYIDNVINIKK